MMSNDLQEYIKSLDIQEIRLISGEHILAEILHQSDDEFAIKDPILVERPIGSGQTAFIEWFPYSEDQYFSLNKDHIVCASEVDYHSKVHFCRMATANKVRRIGVSGSDVSTDDMQLFRELLIEESNLNQSRHSSHTQDDAAEPAWVESLDTSIIH